MRVRSFFYCLKAGSLQLLLVVLAILLLCQGTLWLQSSAFGVRSEQADAVPAPASNVFVLTWNVFSGKELRKVALSETALPADTTNDEPTDTGAEMRSIPLIVGERALNSLWVIGLAMLAIIGLGLPLGILRGKSRRNPLAWLLAVPSAIGVCLPVYWLAAVAAWWMLDRQGIPLPGSQSADLGVSVVSPGVSWMVERWSGFLLAGLIAVAGTGWLVRSVSGGIQHAARADYLWVSRMRGMRESRLFHRHTLRNALRPLVMGVVDLLPFVIGALLLGEGVLGFSGLGGLVFEAGLVRDFAVLLPATLLLAVGILGMRLSAWIVVAWFDPQAGGEGESLL